MNDYFDPIEEADKIRQVVQDGDKRKYYRVARPGRWYGGIATADCLGCNLKCIFCWSNKPRDNPSRIGGFYGPDDVAQRIIKCAQDNNYKHVRISGNEPTLSSAHLIKILSIIERSKYQFILETNGTLLDRELVRGLSQFKKLHVRVSLKGTTGEEFALLTGAMPSAFDAIFENVKYLVEYEICFNIATMLSFSPDKNIVQLKTKLKQISPTIADKFEDEYVFLYPHVVTRLKRAQIIPLIAYTPNGIPKKLV